MRRRRTKRSSKRRSKGRRVRRSRINTHGGWRFHSAGGSLGEKRHLGMRCGKEKNGRCHISCKENKMVKPSKGNSHLGTGPQWTKRVSRMRQRKGTRYFPFIIWQGGGKWTGRLRGMAS